MTLAGIGLYGVLAFAVAQRTHEMGIRMALGARPRQILVLVVGQGMALTLAGLAVGLICAFGSARLVASSLYGVQPTDPLTFGSSEAVIAFVALLAMLPPRSPRDEGRSDRGA